MCLLDEEVSTLEQRHTHVRYYRPCYIHLHRISLTHYPIQSVRSFGVYVHYTLCCHAIHRCAERERVLLDGVAVVVVVVAT